MTRTETPLSSASIEELFDRAGALRIGHFLLKSGRHSDRYLEKFLVLQHPSIGVEICRRLAATLTPHDPTLVVGPTTGGVLLSFETARQLESVLGHPVRAAFAEPTARGRALRRGWELRADERVVLVDDILTTGASLAETVQAVRAAGVEPVAATVMVDRSTSSAELAIPINALGRVEIGSWLPEECDLCRAGVPLTKPGSS